MSYLQKNETIFTDFGSTYCRPMCHILCLTGFTSKSKINVLNGYNRYNHSDKLINLFKQVLLDLFF